ncbi:MAG: hypothetical protein IJL46_06985 [Clostridia bacterium]|nr:hypothetical protein [Clostridia bacterium]MBQ5957295.1 hypothetical protein [Clostridia bacterium]
MDHLMTGNKITLDDGEEYVLLSDTEKDGKRYLLAMGMEKDTLSEDRVAILEEIRDDEGLFVDRVTDRELIEELLPELKEKL